MESSRRRQLVPGIDDCFCQWIEWLSMLGVVSHSVVMMNRLLVGGEHANKKGRVLGDPPLPLSHQISIVHVTHPL